MTSRVLFVDDDPNLLAGFQRNLRKQFSFDTALGGVEALEKLDTSGPYAVVLADMRMPGMDGVELLERVRERSPDTVRMMLTGNADQQTAVDAVNRGQVFRFLNKPCPPEVLIPALEGAIKHFQLLQVERDLLEGTLTASVKMLTDVLGMVAPDALGRGQRLRDSMRRLAEEAGAKPLWELEIAALLSNVGFAAVPPVTLRKIATGAQVTPVEEVILRRVPQVGHELLAGIPRLPGVAEIVLYQAQNFDGTGFPGDGKAAEALPIGARLLKILTDRADLEADGVVQSQAKAAMTARTGAYDPRLLDLCFQCFPKFLAQPVSSDLPVQTLFVRQLRPGHVVVSDIVSPGKVVLATSGHRLTAMTLERLRNHAEMNDVKEPVLVQDAPPENLPKMSS
jgi:response regulator RpfG family c-di-GMP phosphodiesterase